MKNISGKKVIVGMSGGVDSSVTAALLKEQGFDVIGVFMKNWSQDFGDFGCTWAEDAEDARKVAEVLKVPFYVWNFEKEYYSKVVEYFLREYKAGRTPNPDVMCNSEIKFKVFLDKALSLGADYVATGHYARIAHADGKYSLLKGIDPAKDQSYFLYTLNQKQLSKILFPIGTLTKPEVRELARKFNLPNHSKKDSQGICFIGKINVKEFLKAHIPVLAGEIVTTGGQSLGKHDGLAYYTIGQREGMGLGGKGPYYVVNKDFSNNRLVVSNNGADPDLWKKEFTIEELKWTGKDKVLPLKAKISIRYHHPDYPAVILKTGNKTRVVFDEPQRAITPGQAAVIYDGEELIGGGIIDKVF
ncbi:MAG TPA: tRNA 2-thiouridine(34) synthase MnmA [Patescibacteria group bacterium]|jgi:tRNA-specific 2-thiouridylase|nr:tRNA 2-thiouridine(34) synthase MnmA [Patescibacteria group bacterium]